MINNDNSLPAQILKKAKSILLVDWPDKGVPCALINAEFNVFSYSPGVYTTASIDPEKDDVVFKQLDGPPVSVDIVNVFRPIEELTYIIETQVLPLNAKVVWLHPPLSTAKWDKPVFEQDLIFIEGHDIAKVASQI